MAETFYTIGESVYCGKKVVQEMQSRKYAEQLEKHLNEIHKGGDKK